ncbi:unnamed protein product [Adineta steineri]|nr:unnamed protein product [Adineta steineri]
MAVDDENRDAINPLLTNSSYTDNYTNDNPVDSTIKINENTFKSSTISFEKINYTIPQTEPTKNSSKWSNLLSCNKQTINRQILSDISGAFTTGMNAILGPTGCGKSTLLDILTDRKDHHGLTGNVLVCGKPRSTNFKHTIGYVIQEGTIKYILFNTDIKFIFKDIISGTLTVRENLMFSANVRLQHTLSVHERINRVNKIIHDLDLQSCADTFIGTDLIRGISGGEKKRTSIGMELVLLPNILFLDEPTTGLDASTAHSVMNCLNNLSRQGRTIIFSIHQPRYSIFKLFDTVLFLSNGHIVYFGLPMNVLPYFNSQGFQCEEHENPADFVLDVLLDTNGRSSKILQHSYLQSTMYSDNMSLIKSTINENHIDESHLLNENISRSFTSEFYYVAQRTIRNAIRNPELTASQILISTALGLLTGLLFYNMKATVHPGVSNRIGAIFFFATHQILCTANALEPLIKERVLFIHENASGYYRVITYFLAKIICDLIPLRLIPSFIFSIISYPLMGFQRSIHRFLRFFIAIFVSSVFGSALCFFIAACIPTFAVALIITILIFATMMVVSGFLVDLDSIFSFLQWIKWISAIRYSSNLLTINEFQDLTFCLSNNTHICPLQGEQILIERKIPYITDWDVWKNVFMMILMAVVCLIMAYIQLLRIKKVK